MQRIVQIVCLVVWCIPFQGFAQNGKTPILDKKISISAQEQKLEKILDEISAKTGLYFSYDPTVVNPEKITTVHCAELLVSEVLDGLFQDEYDYQVLKNQVIITKPANDSKQLDFYQKERESDFMKISGHITDKMNQKSVPYASVAILGKAFGTITNIDGDFEIKIPVSFQKDTLFISCMGYAQQFIKLDTLQLEKLDLSLSPVDIRLGEIKVTAIKPLEVIDKLLERRTQNYPVETYLMTAFYREVLKQDNDYVNVSEAVLNILKASYKNVIREDRIRFIKGRKSPDIFPLKWVDFKMQGGPYYITKLDVMKTMDTFLDRAYRDLYSYQAEQLIEYMGRPTYVISFKPMEKVDFLSYEGKLYIDKESFALVHANFELGRDGLKFARRSLIRKKPKNLKVRPIDLVYQVSYKENEGKWHLNTAQTSVKFRVRSKKDKINAIFHSISDLLITFHEETDIKRFDREESVSSTDIFTEMIIDYDQEFWGQFNIIKPNENLRNALSKVKSASETERNYSIKPNNHITKKQH